MWIKTETFAVMAGEPHLGNQVEEEVMYEPEEIQEALDQAIKDDGEAPEYLYFMDDYTDQEIEIKVKDYI